VGKAGERLTIRQTEPTLRSLEGLDPGLLVDAQDERVLGRVEVQPDDVGAPSGANSGSVVKAPTPPSAQANPLAAQGPPDLVRGDIAERRGEEGSGPGRMPGRGPLVEGGEDPARSTRHRGARTRCVDQAGQSVTGEAGPPLCSPAPAESAAAGRSHWSRCRRQRQGRSSPVRPSAGRTFRPAARTGASPAASDNTIAVAGFRIHGLHTMPISSASEY